MQLPNDANSLMAALAKLPQQKIANAVSVLLVVYIAYLAANLTWLSVPNNTNAGASNTRAVASSAEKESRVFDVSGIKSLNLFGEYNAKQEAPKPVEVQNAPETRLNLTLAGVIASQDVTIATAIIENAGKQNTYGIGDKIDGTRATLEQVYFDRVIVRNSGRLETLMLDGVKFSRNSEEKSSSKRNLASADAKPVQRNSSRTRKSKVDNRNNKEVTAQIGNLKEQINQDPGKITDYLRISPKRKDGEVVGYILRPGKDPEFFRASGLKAGDVAVQMNGFDLTSTLEAAQALQALKTETEVALWVDRDGDVTEILFSLSN